jgi:hypothetical protein
LASAQRGSTQTVRVRIAFAYASVAWSPRTRSRKVSSKLRRTRRPRGEVVHWARSAQAAQALAGAWEIRRWVASLCERKRSVDPPGHQQVSVPAS